jgi:Ca2+-binding EF-hand superfamily protein
MGDDWVDNAPKQTELYVKNLSAQQIGEYYECFRYYDRDMDQKLTASEVVTCLRALGINMSQREMREVPESIGDDKVDWNRFLSIIAPKGNRKTTQDDIRQAFNVFDKEQSGRISIDELTHVITTLGPDKLTVEQVESLVRDSGLPQAGRINYQEFVSLLRYGERSYND